MPFGASSHGSRNVLSVMFLCGFHVFIVHCSPVTLTLLFTNDVHTQFTSFNDKRSACSDEDVVSHRCYGGAARRATAINSIRKVEDNVLLLDAGDQFQGTVWFSRFREYPIAIVMNLMKYDAMTLGNHEFDNGLDSLEGFIRNLSFPVLSTNLVTVSETLNDVLVDVMKLSIDGLMVAILGVTTPETEYLSMHGAGLKIENQVDVLQRWVEQLKREGIEFIIVLSHSGLSVDIEMCQSVPGIGVIIGGHSHSFIYTGEPPSSEVPINDYPVVVWNEDQPCLVTQAYVSGKYLGYLQVEVENESGNILSWNGQPILVDSTFKEDEEVQLALSYFEDQLLRDRQTTVGWTAVELNSEGKVCRLGECSIGNLICDSFVDRMVYTLDTAFPFGQWTRSAIALLNGGTIRQFVKKAPGVITMADALTIIPFENYLALVRVTGKVLLAALEYSVWDYSPTEPRGNFLQTSGIHVTYNISKPNGNRVQTLTVRCQLCSLPTYDELDLDQEYSVIMTRFLANGGDGFKMFKDSAVYSELLDITYVDAFQSYLAKYSPVTIGLDDRSIIVS